MDVHDLLLKFAENGYNPAIWDALAARISNDEAGKEWRAANEKLIASTNGLLAAFEADTVEFATGRGSHGSAALRVAEDCPEHSFRAS